MPFPRQQRFFFHTEAKLLPGQASPPAGCATLSEIAPDKTDANGGGGGHLSTSSGAAASQLNKPTAIDNTTVVGAPPTTNPPNALHQFCWFTDYAQNGIYMTGNWTFVFRELDALATITSHWTVNLYANTTRNFASPIRFVKQIVLSVDNSTGTTSVQTQTISVPGFALTNEFLIVQVWCHETAGFSASQSMTFRQEGVNLADSARSNILTATWSDTGWLPAARGGSG